MRTHSFLFALIGAATLAFTACEPKNNPDDPTGQDTVKVQDTIKVQSFAKKNLIEEFTGQGCGYCPYGMDCVHDFIKNDNNWIVVLHHYGYDDDNFTIKGSDQIGSKLKVDGAPSITINRAKTNYGAGSSIVFHPGYLENTKTAQFETTTYASLDIKNTYDANSRSLKVAISGLMGKADYPDLKLTVLVKESGMIDFQADYYNSYEGWKEFRHTNAVRAFLTDPMGDSIAINARGEYFDTLTINLSSKWNAENCMVVAFLSENDFKPVVQANECPVVECSKGGADIQHGGITRVPIDDFYPEPSATAAPKDYSGLEADTLAVAQASYKSYSSDGFKFWSIMAYNSEYSFKLDGTACIPAAFIYVFTELSATTIPNGTYPFSIEPKPGNAYAGYRDDAHFDIGGSNYSPASQAYFKQGYLVPVAQWLIVSGSLTVTDEGWSVKGQARNGAAINLEGKNPITYKSNNAPAKKPALMMQNASQPRKMLPIIR